MKQDTKKAKRPVMNAVERVLGELTSGYGNPGDSFRPFKEVIGAQLSATFFDAAAEEAYGVVEIETVKQDPDASIGNGRTRAQFRISHGEAKQIAKEAPEEFRDNFRRIVETMDELCARNAPAAAARKKQKLEDIEDSMTPRRAIDAPGPAKFSKTRGKSHG